MQDVDHQLAAFEVQDKGWVDGFHQIKAVVESDVEFDNPEPWYEAIMRVG